MTKQELTNLYELLSAPNQAPLAFEIAKGYGLSEMDLITLLWCYFNDYIEGLNRIRILRIGEYKIRRLDKTYMWAALGKGNSKHPDSWDGSVMIMINYLLNIEQ